MELLPLGLRTHWKGITVLRVMDRKKAKIKIPHLGGRDFPGHRLVFALHFNMNLPPPKRCQELLDVGEILQKWCGKDPKWAEGTGLAPH